MGNGTKIGLVLVLVLVVVVIANLLDSEVEKGPTGVDQAPRIEKRAEEPGSGASPNRPASALGNRARPGSPGYEEGRNRRLTQNPPASNRDSGARPLNGGSPELGSDPTETKRPAAGNSGTASAPGTDPAAGELGPESRKPTSLPVSTDPTGLRASPTGAGLSSPAVGTEPNRTGIRPAVGGEGNPANSATGGERGVEIVGHDPNEPTTDPSSENRTRTLPPSTPAGTKRESASRPGSSGFPREHEVKDGENLWKIAEQEYGKGHLFTVILAGNPKLGEGHELQIGQKITLPAPPVSAAAKQGTAAVSATPKTGFRAYKIQDGDTLYDIAEERLGSGLRWTEIQVANPGLDPARLRVGAEIQIPAT